MAITSFSLQNRDGLVLGMPVLTLSCADIRFAESSSVGMQACGDVMIMIGQHGRSVHEVIPAYLWGKGDSHFFSCIIIT